MKINLDKTEFVDLVCGTNPNFNLFTHKDINRCGDYNGSYGTWSWKRHELRKLTEEQLYNMYKLCKDLYK